MHARLSLDKAEFFKKCRVRTGLGASSSVVTRRGQEPPASRQARNGQAAGVSVDACQGDALFASFDFTLHHIRSEGYQPVYSYPRLVFLQRGGLATQAGSPHPAYRLRLSIIWSGRA